MPNNPSTIVARLGNVRTAWERLASEKSFGGMTLTQFNEIAKASVDTRTQIAGLEKQMTALHNQRDDADVVTNDTLQKVVKGVMGDPDFGEDSALYEAMGYVRKSERKSGLSRRKEVSAPTT